MTDTPISAEAYAQAIDDLERESPEHIACGDRSRTDCAALWIRRRARELTAARASEGAHGHVVRALRMAPCFEAAGVDPLCTSANCVRCTTLRSLAADKAKEQQT